MPLPASLKSYNAWLDSTRNHRFYQKDAGWIAIEGLGDSPLLYVYYEKGIESFNETYSEELVYPEAEKVYNFTVKENRNYFVGDLGVLVHNRKI